MDPMVALVIAGGVAVLALRASTVRAPSRILLAKPTTVWPLASVGAGIGLAGAAVLVLVRLGVGAVAVLVGALVLLFMTSVGKSTTQPTRLVYERGATAILRSRLILVVGLFFGILWILQTL